jgi:phage gp36-like protein
MATQYATQADLENACGGTQRLVQLTDWNNDRTADADRITSALESASAEVSSYLAKQRYVPLALPYPQMVIAVTARIARYRLAASRSRATQQDRDDFESDTKWLVGVSDGTIKLDVDPQPLQASDRIDGFSERPTSKDISRSKLGGFW